MAVYLVQYDLIKELNSSSYQPLWDAFKKAGAHRTMLSCWLVASTATAKQVHDHFAKFLDSNDRLWVVQVHRNTGSLDEYSYVNAHGALTLG